MSSSNIGNGEVNHRTSSNAAQIPAERPVSTPTSPPDEAGEDDEDDTGTIFDAADFDKWAAADTHSLVKEIAAQGGRKMYALMGVSLMEAAARIKKQLIDTIGTIAARGHAQLLLARLSALAPIAAQRGNTTNSNQQIISLNALARAHYRRSIGTRGGAQASAAD
ncbi:hypothetical protein T492DRAFT_877436 [Pavlovales sp. CCMP2436]|nr:hypothetical protein T492DRAFT_877436 [Pavlovales sp. CCMP2436]